VQGGGNLTASAAGVFIVMKSFIISIIVIIDAGVSSIACLANRHLHHSLITNISRSAPILTRYAFDHISPALHMHNFITR